jgi:spermidine synthase
LGEDASLTVAELVPEVIAWASGAMAEVFAGCLEDPRVTLHQGDVGELIRDSEASLGCDIARRRQWSRRPYPPGQ